MFEHSEVFSNFDDSRNSFKYQSKLLTLFPQSVNKCDPHIRTEENVTKKIQNNNLEIEHKLLDTRRVYPLAYNEGVENYLNVIGFSEESNDDTLQNKSRKRGRTSSRRSVSRERSASPGGIKKMKEGKWDIKAQMTCFVIDEILSNFKDYSTKDFISKKCDKPMKDLIKQLKNEDDNERLKSIKLYENHILVLALKYLLKQLGLIIPQYMSEEFLLIKELILKKKDDKELNINGVNKVKASLFTISIQSRTLLNKLLTLFNCIYNNQNLSYSKIGLFQWLRPSLFEGEENKNQLNLCCDFITLSEELFNAPEGLFKHVIEQVNSRINNDVMIKVIPLTQVKDKSNSSMTSPQKLLNKESPKKKLKRKSLTNFAIKIKQTLSPSRKSYDISKFYSHEKKVTNDKFNYKC